MKIIFAHQCAIASTVVERFVQIFSYQYRGKIWSKEEGVEIIKLLLDFKVSPFKNERPTGH